MCGSGYGISEATLSVRVSVFLEYSFGVQEVVDLDGLRSVCKA